MGHNHSGDLDRLIDTALPGYSEATPRPGLGQRVLNRIRIAEADRRRFKFLRVALAVVALLLLVIVLRKPRSAPKISPEISRVADRPKAITETKPAAIRPDLRFKVA